MGTQDLTSITPEPHISDSHLATNINPSCNTESFVGPKIGTWRRLGPPTHAMDTSEKPELVLAQNVSVKTLNHIFPFSQTKSKNTWTMKQRLWVNLWWTTWDR